MNMRSVVGVILVLAVVGGGIYYFSSQNSAGPAAEITGDQNTTAGMRVGDNAVIVNEQLPGNIVIASAVYLASPGFVVIHEDSNGAPAAILGASALLQAGENTNIKVTLSRTTKNGEKLHAMLHSDTDGNGTFSASVDVPVQSTLGGPIEGWFGISSSASVDVPVSI